MSECVLGALVKLDPNLIMAKAAKGTYTRKVGKYTLEPTALAIAIVTAAYKIQGSNDPLVKFTSDTQKQVVDLLGLGSNPRVLSFPVWKPAHEFTAGERAAYLIARATAVSRL